MGFTGTIMVLSLITSPSAAQSGGEQFRHYTTRDGLSNTFIWQMIQDRHGFIWTVGNAGLEKFDGQTFTAYRHVAQNPESVPGGEMRAIVETADGNLWIGSSQGLAIFNPALEISKTVLVADSLRPARFVWALHQENNGDIWAGTGDGLYHFPIQDFTADTLQTHLYLFNEDEEVSKTIRSIAPHGNDKFWLGTNSGLFIFDRFTREFSKAGDFEGQLDEMLSSPIWKVLNDRNNNLWISTTYGFVVWKNGAETPEPLNTFPNSDLDLTGSLIQSIFEDEKGLIYVGTGFFGGLILNPDTMEITGYRHEEGNINSIAEGDVHYFFKDRDGNFWFGYHFRGISLMYRESWSYQFNRVIETAGPGDFVNQVRSLTEDEHGNLWLGTSNSIVMKPADGSEPKQFMPDFDGEPTNQQGRWIIDLHSSKEGIYVLSQNRLHFIKMPEETISYIDFREEISRFFSLQGDENYLYIGAENSGMLVVDKADHSYTVYNNPFNNPDNDEVKILEPILDLEGTIWVGEIDGFTSPFTWKLHRFDLSTGLFENALLPSPNDLERVGIPVPSKTEPGVFWMTSSRGILKQHIPNRENRFYLPDDPSVNASVFFGILADRDDYIWIGGMDGVRRFDPVTESLNYFEPESNRRPNSFAHPIQRSNDDILFGGFGGYIQFSPYDLQEEPPIGFIHLTEIRAGADVYHLLYNNQREYTFDHSSNNLSFSFIALNYKSPTSTRYRYRLLGYQEEWVDIGIQTQVFLANLAPGNYTFQIQARNSSGSYSPTIAEVGFSILPPWWRTMPAYILFLLLFFGLIFIVDRVQRQRLLTKEKERARETELEHAKEIEKAFQRLELAHENLKAAQDQLVQQEKLASLGQLTAGIAHEIKNPLNFVNNFSDLSVELIDEVREEINSVGAIHELPLQNISDILDDIEANLRKIHEHGSRADGIVQSMLMHSRGGDGKMESAPLNPIIKEYVNLAFHGMRAGKEPIDVDIDLQMDESIGDVPLIAEDFSRVILNLVNNAFDAMREKQGAGGYEPKLTVRTKSNNGKVSIEIEDNGPGIPADIKDKILQPFFTTKKGTQGTGLGLSITHDIVKAHGGTIEIESDAGEITTFLITLKQE